MKGRSRTGVARAPQVAAVLQCHAASHSSGAAAYVVLRAATGGSCDVEQKSVRCSLQAQLAR